LFGPFGGGDYVFLGLYIINRKIIYGWALDAHDEDTT